MSKALNDFNILFTESYKYYKDYVKTTRHPTYSNNQLSIIFNQLLKEAIFLYKNIVVKIKYRNDLKV